MALGNIKKAFKMLRSILRGQVDENIEVTDAERQFMESMVGLKRRLTKPEKARLIEIVGRFEKKPEAETGPGKA